MGKLSKQRFPKRKSFHKTFLIFANNSFSSRIGLEKTDLIDHCSKKTFKDTISKTKSHVFDNTMILKNLEPKNL